MSGVIEPYVRRTKLRRRPIEEMSEHHQVCRQRPKQKAAMASPANMGRCLIVQRIILFSDRDLLQMGEGFLMRADIMSLSGTRCQAGGCNIKIVIQRSAGNES